MKLQINRFAIFFFMFFSINAYCSAKEKVLSGLDRVNTYAAWFTGKRIGLITNPTAVNAHGEYIVQIFQKMAHVRITALFGPEHGIHAKQDAGKKIVSTKDDLSGIPVFSLYGKVRKPTTQMLAHVDVLVFDIQDIGTRYYTYIWTMALAMEAAAEQGKPFVVLDRPNPITGVRVEGNILDKQYASFVGLLPVPVRHGLTVGELARLFNGEGWLKNGVQADLKVVPLKNWRRSVWFDQTGLPFIKPSPNMPDLETAIVYPGLCLLEGTNVSEGRGTLQPFKHFGAPWINARKLTEALNALNLSGVVFSEAHFVPRSIKGMAANPKYLGHTCNGAQIKVTHRDIFKPFRSGLKILETLQRLYPDSLRWHRKHFDRLCGTDQIRKTIISGGNLEALINSWQDKLERFNAMREKYLLY